MSEANIPLVDLGLQHRRIADEVRVGFDRVLENTSFILGPEAASFEQAYADFCGAAHCVGVGNGTDAVELALRACRIGVGDEVIIPANTFIATAEAVVRTGATLVLADCDENYLIDPASVAAKVTSKTKAVIAVHLYGQLAPIEKLTAVVGAGVAIIEDAAQSQGASRHGAVSGSLGAVAATSFYPGKNLGAYGDAGAVTTNDGEIATSLRMLRNHGGIAKYEHVEIGVNSRLDGLQAVVLNIKLARLNDWNAERKSAAAIYTDLLAGEGSVTVPQTLPGNEHVWHLFVIRVADRDNVVAKLNAVGVGAGVHYPLAVHQLPAFSGMGLGSYPVAERLAAEILSLPIFPGITPAQQERVVEELRTILK